MAFLGLIAGVEVVERAAVEGERGMVLVCRCLP